MFYSLPRTSQTSVTATNGDTVLNINTGLTYSTIQAAIDANETLNGHTILVGAKTYVEHVTVNKSLALLGETTNTTIIEGNGSGVLVRIVVNNVVFKNFTVENGDTGIMIDHANNTLVTRNNVIGNTDAIAVYYSHNCTIDQNTVRNKYRGIFMSNSDNFNVNNNQIYPNTTWGMYGINANSSMNGLIRQNIVFNQYFDGIGVVDSRNLVVIENTVGETNFFGALVQGSNDISIYHNNFLNNGLQANATYDSTVTWDNGYPSGGNYWSNYQGGDENGDGIGDVPYTISADNVDHYPLMTQYVIPEFPSATILFALLTTTLAILMLLKRRQIHKS
jgi:parallel beta-helix repeat protein